MFRLTKPSQGDIGSFLADQRRSVFSYPDVGASGGKIPDGYNLDHNRIQLGRGEVTWCHAVEAVRSCQMFNMPWLHLYPPGTPIKTGNDVVISVHHFGLYSLNACRIVYVVDELGPVMRFGFAYGTLSEHAESGEERFTVEWNRDQDEVWYDILAFSRPHQTLAKLAYPVARSLQKKFATHSMAAMCAAIDRK